MFKILENNFNLNDNKKENEILKENIKKIDKNKIEIDLLNILINFYELKYIIEIENKYKTNKFNILLKDKNFYNSNEKKLLMLLFYDLNNYEYNNIKETIKLFNNYMK